MVTISACSTGLGKLVSGEGILGLTRAMFYAGARNVVVSLWNVNDSATATLMEAFYRQLIRGLPKSEALRQAKLALIRGTRQPLWRIINRRALRHRGRGSVNATSPNVSSGAQRNGRVSGSE